MLRLSPQPKSGSYADILSYAQEIIEEAETVASSCFAEIKERIRYNEDLIRAEATEELITRKLGIIPDWDLDQIKAWDYVVYGLETDQGKAMLDYYPKSQEIQIASYGSKDFNDFSDPHIFDIHWEYDGLLTQFHWLDRDKGGFQLYPLSRDHELLLLGDSGLEHGTANPAKFRIQEECLHELSYHKRGVPLSFWELYETADPQHKKILLRDWLPLNSP